MRFIQKITLAFGVIFVVVALVGFLTGGMTMDAHMETAPKLAGMFPMNAAHNGGLNIAIVDTCLDNPFTGEVVASAAALPPHTLVAYATAPGGFAADGRRHIPCMRQYILRAQWQSCSALYRSPAAGCPAESANIGR